MGRGKQKKGKGGKAKGGKGRGGCTMKAVSKPSNPLCQQPGCTTQCLTMKFPYCVEHKGSRADQIAWSYLLKRFQGNAQGGKPSMARLAPFVR